MLFARGLVAYRRDRLVSSAATSTLDGIAAGEVRLDSYICGFVMREVAWPGTSEETFEPAADFAERTLVAAYPHQVGIAQIVARGDWDIGRNFERGLDLLFDALENERARAGGP